MSRPDLVPLRALAFVLVAAGLAGCASLPGPDPRAHEGTLRNSLTVAAAALAAGQLDVARRLYRSLDTRFPDLPQPPLGLGYLALHARDFARAERHFVAAAQRSGATPETKAEAFLGAGRAALARADLPDVATREARLQAREYLRQGLRAGPRSPSVPWIANAMGVAAALDSDYRGAEAHYVRALRAAPQASRIAANLVRVLVAAGRAHEAARRYARYPRSHWSGDDAQALERLIGQARQGVPAVRAGPDLVLRLSAFDLPKGRRHASDRSAFIASSPLLLRLGRSSGEARAPVASDRAPSTTFTLTLGHSRRLYLARNATAVLVSDPQVADVQLLSPDVAYVVGRSVGRTSVVVLDDGRRVDERVVSVVLDLAPLRRVLADRPGLERVRARAFARGTTLTGEVSSAAAAERAMRLAASTLPEGTPIENELRIAALQQVNLEVLIAEVQRSATEDLGVSWEAVQSRGKTGIGFAIGRDFLQEEEDGTSFVRNVVDGRLVPGLGFVRETGRGRLSGMIDALATAGLANVLARPSLTAVSGESASFFSGGEYPLPTGFEDGTIVFEYKKFGVLLDFVPTVVDSGRIVLTVRPEVSEPSETRALEVVGIAIPVLNVRRAQTTVEVGDGESIVIAGLFRNATDTTESGLPGLKDIPLLGLLFGTTRVRSDELELIVVVTARLVSPERADPQRSGPGASAGRIGGYHH